MTELTALARPPEWSGRERHLWFTPCVTASLVAAIVAVVLGLDNFGAGLVAGAAAVLLLAVVLVFPRPRPVLVEQTGEGVRFPFRRRSRSLTLTPTGVVLRRGTIQVIAWDELSEISAWSHNFAFTLWPIRQNLITLESHRPDKGVMRWFFRGMGRTLRTVRFTTDPVVVYHALRFYLTHPDLRPELGGAAAVERIRAGNLGE